MSKLYASLDSRLQVTFSLSEVSPSCMGNKLMRRWDSHPEAVCSVYLPNGGLKPTTLGTPEGDKCAIQARDVKPL